MALHYLPIFEHHDTFLFVDTTNTFTVFGLARKWSARYHWWYVFTLGIYGVAKVLQKSLTIFYYEIFIEEPISKFNFFAVSKPIQILEYCIPIGLHSDKN